jgi:site-specific recombinase XerD
MDDTRQKIQLELAFEAVGPGEARAAAARGGIETSTAKPDTESPSSTERLMEEVCERENLRRALRRVRENRGSPGIDGMTVGELPGHLKKHWPAIREQLLNGTYKPQPGRRVSIPKPDGGRRLLGIPTVLDRFIQQAVLQVLQGRWDRTFSEHSYGFRPGRSAHQAVAQAQRYARQGDRWVVDLDQEKFGSSPLSVKTLAAETSVLRSFCAWLAARRVLLFNPAEGLVLGDRSEPLPKTVLTESEVQALLAAPGRDAVGLRDRAILEMLYSTGLRRAELCGLDLYDVDQAGEVVRVRQGKGRKDRYVPVGAHALEALRRYLHAARPELVATSREPALFVASITGRRLGRQTLNLIVRKHGESAGIGRRVTPHVLRHTCATHLLQGGADLRHVQAILGHASIATIQVYTRVAAEDLAAVHRRHHPRRRLKIP